MTEYRRTIYGRLKLIGMLFIFMTGILIWRMVNISVFQYEKYSALASGQQRYEKTEMASRGKILVHDSVVDPSNYYPLAFDLKKFALWIVPREIKDKKTIAEKLAKLTNLPADEIFTKINNDKVYIPPIMRGLSLDQGNVIKKEKLPGIYVMPEYSRYYPEGNLASQVLGFVNGEGKGNYGFEGFYNDELKGKEGNVVGEKDTLGRVISLLEQTDPEDGNSYVLTLDRSVQFFVEKKLKEALELYQADSGTVAVMDVKTGGVVAMASLPNYDPNNFREQAKSNPSLFNNPAISHLYEPGSIFKPLIMAAALDQGVVRPETEGTFDWHVFVDGYEIKTAERKAFGKQNMTEVLQNSDNVAMVWISELLGKENEYKYLKLFNMLDKTDIDLSGEATGYTRPFKEWKDVHRSTIAFGQGIAVTPIEMLAAYTAIANKGVYVYPHIVDKIIFPNGKERQVEKKEGTRVISEATARTMADMLYNVAEKGHSQKARVAGFKVGAKTGTAQIPKTDGTGYEQSEDGLGIFVHSLAGFAPTDDPQFAMLVKLDRPKSARYAESTAAPLFGEIASFLLNYHYRVKPTE